ncbi:MAG: aminopeptidase P family protein [Victivallales bacterium]|nr:aminopeptidase P family protein [Victivallales bacterium]
MGIEKIDKLLTIMRESEIDSLLVVKPSNIRYLTGFTGHFAYVVGGPDKPALFTSPIYSEHARAVVNKLYTVREITGKLYDFLAAQGESFWGHRVGFEADKLTCDKFEKLNTAFDGSVELVPFNGYIEKLRMIKKESEIDSIIRAQRISESVLDEVLSLLKEGVEERDIANEIEYLFRKRGGDRQAFDTIVAFGENSSRPHAIPSGRRLRNGDVVLFDMGTIFDGYASDMTRTFVFGQARAVFRDIYEAVFNAQMAALEGLKAGVKCSDADSLARNVIDADGYGELFVHSLGHGVGLDVHEPPALSKASDSVLESGMVVTVEPGIYRPGWGGVRIEDLVVVTDNGCENLTKFPKELIEL